MIGEIGLAVAHASDASTNGDERERFLAAIASAEAARCEEILAYADVALVGLDNVSVYFSGEAFLVECMLRASDRLAALGAACAPVVRNTTVVACWRGRCRNERACECRAWSPS